LQFLFIVSSLETDLYSWIWVLTSWVCTIKLLYSWKRLVRFFWFTLPLLVFSDL
jgi:hypothetical protein